MDRTQMVNAGPDRLGALDIQGECEVIKWVLFGAGCGAWIVGVSSEEIFLLPAAIMLGLCAIADAIERRPHD